MKKTKEALFWIATILRKNKIPFQITGGFAAKVYGSKRKLSDIDIELPNKFIYNLEDFVKGKIIYGPRIYKSKNFELLLMTLKFKGQIIDLCGTENQRIFNKTIKKWEDENIDLSKSIRKKTYGLIVPMIQLKDLINYKEKIRRKVDLIDIKNII
ncbi:MAG: hypothetical protein Q8Q04_02765 [archaeon]|nr:hypothetical protein [archaeon]